MIEWSGGKISKALVAKQDCVVGDHYHRNKEERFLLLSGTALVVIIGNQRQESISAPCEFIVPPNTYHLFGLVEGSILLGVASREFDPADEIKGEPC